MNPKPIAITEQEMVEEVQRIAAQDEDYDIPERYTYEELVETLLKATEYRPPEIPISEDKIRNIVSTYAPNAPHRSAHKAEQKSDQPIPKVETSVPPELEKVPIKDYHDDRWFVKRCPVCRQYNSHECCNKEAQWVVAVNVYGELTKHGRQAAGLETIEPPKPLKPKEERWQEAKWWKSFSGADELEDGGVKMFIENFLPEGITLVCGLPKEGKSFLAMSIVKALTSGKPLFGISKFRVPESVPVLYLAAEVSDRAFKQRLAKFGITNDKTKFLCRTLTKGPRLGLNHPDVVAIVENMKPIIILDTIIRFNNAEDEDSAMDNQKLADAIFYLRALGAKAVIGLHHSRKDIKEGQPTLERAVRGSGDLSAMCDVVWALVRDERLYKNNNGPNEVDLIGWGRDFNAEPLRLALTKRAPSKTMIGFAPGIVSVIDETGDMGMVTPVPANSDELERLVQQNPNMTIRELAQETDMPYRDIQQTLRERGWTKDRGPNSCWKQAIN
jgi:AAA domain